MTVSRPLDGARVVVTRPREQAAPLAGALRSRGAQPVLFPTIAIVPVADTRRLDAAIASLDTFDWVIFTSVNGVRYFGERLAEMRVDAARVRRVRVAAIGPATRDALASLGIATSFVPDEYVAERIAEGLGDVRGRRCLLARAAQARPALRELLQGGGASVQEVAVYTTVTAQPEDAAAVEAVREADAVTFTSSSTVRGFCELLPDAADVLERAVVACIGPITAATAREAGARVDVVAARYTSDGLVEGLVNHFGEAGPAMEVGAP